MRTVKNSKIKINDEKDVYRQYYIIWSTNNKKKNCLMTCEKLFYNVKMNAKSFNNVDNHLTTVFLMSIMLPRI